MKGFSNWLPVTIFLCLANLLPAGAQLPSPEDLSPRQMLRFARTAVKGGDTYSAIYFYGLYHDIKPANMKVAYTLAELNRAASNYPKALDLYSTVAKKAAKKYPMAHFYYAQMLKATGKYDEAITEFNNYRRSLRGSKDERSVSRIIRNEIDGCDSARKIMARPLNISIENLNPSVNSPHVDFSPIPVDENTLIYASLRIDSLVFVSQGGSAEAELPNRQFYMARKKENEWVGGLPFEGPINLPGVETGNGVISRDGRRFYFTRCTRNFQGNMICAIYLSQKQNNTWQTPEKLPVHINDPNFSSTQPALGRTAQTNREVIYFASDRPDGRGGLDIWYTIRNDKTNQYSKIRNAGSKINTPGDEMTPFYDLPTRTLYFSSNGHPGLGGLDIFSSFGERRLWTTAKNIGYPVNASYDDLYFTVSRTGEEGFFVSNRPGGVTFNVEMCCDDIYYYRWNEFIRITVKGIIYPFEKDKYGRKRDLTGFDFMNPSKDIKPLNEAQIALYMQDKESKQYHFMERYHTEPDGMFYFNLQPDQDYQFRMEGFQYFDSEMYLSTQGFNFTDTIEMPPIWVNVMTDKPVVLENIYYEFNSAELNDRAKRAIDTTLLVLMKEAPEFIVEIGAHTDSIGETGYNMKLSQERAAGVVAYLISKGIDKNLLVARGYGAMMPVAPNFFPDGSDNPGGREQNRRTEFRVIGVIGEGEEEDEVFDD